MKKFKTLAKALAICSLSGVLAAPSSATVINLALVLDGSGSVGSDGWALQLNGYLQAFTGANFFNTVVGGSQYTELNVAVWQFGTNVVQEVDWTLIGSQADSTAFGNLFNTTAMGWGGGWTNTEGALKAATDSILGLGALSAGSKSVIDISTDGEPTVCDGGSSSSSSNNNCASGENPKSEALAQANSTRSSNIVVNALGVGTLDEAYLKSLVGINPVSGPQGFYQKAASFDVFGAAILAKLEREINMPPPPAIPVPATLPLMLLGLAGFIFSRRRGAI